MKNRAPLESTPQAIVVGDKNDEFVKEIVHLLNSKNMAWLSCDDVFDATRILSRIDDTDTRRILFGRIDHLNAERGSFFDITFRKNIFCCCLSETSSVEEYLSHLSILRQEGAVINYPSEAAQVLEAIVNLRNERHTKRVPDLSGPNVTTTPEELNALLGEEGQA